MIAAIDVLQDWLDRMSRAMMDDDFASYRTGVDLPLAFVTDAANIIVSDEADLLRGFRDYREMMNLRKVTEYIRLAYAAEQISDHLVVGGYRTEMLSNGTRIVPPFRSRVVLRIHGQDCRAVSIVSALTNARWPILTPAVAPPLAPS